MSNEYVISGGQSGFERLRVLSRVWGDTTESLLRSVGVGPGMRCLDVGCGAGDVSLFLASLVGPSGAVVGSDYDDVQLDMVRAECHRLGVTNVELVREDVMEWRCPAHTTWSTPASCSSTCPTRWTHSGGCGGPCGPEAC